MDDARAVMEAAGSKRAVMIGYSEGSSLVALFATTHPERTFAIQSASSARIIAAASVTSRRFAGSFSHPLAPDGCGSGITVPWS